ncbi:hypothetical protein [Streptomyces sp. NRRL S-37]|uniref:hypothetical protein n=1 Tax=Streptomyces sp. NRRL S-37 TaxID=1463903 RepID=UPI0004CAE47E|nr:hypothetical protein [Streptomyces sp. NRRL S-37]
MVPSLTLAHVVGHGSGPIPRTYALIAGVTALYASFEALRLRWQEPRFDERRVWRGFPEPLSLTADHPLLRRTLRVVGAALALLTLTVLTTGYGGHDLGIGMIYVLFWVGLVPASLLLGPVWRLLNPLRSVHEVVCALTRVPPDAGLRRLPERVGVWPAAVGLLCFGWLELAAPGRGSASAVLLWLWVYGAVQLIAATMYGSRWFERGDTFEVYSSLIAAMSPLGRSHDGSRRLVLRNPFNGLAGVREQPGLTALVSVMLALTAFDSFANTGAWRAVSDGLPTSPARTAGLLGTALLMLGLLRLSAWTARHLSRGASWGAGLMAPSLVPVAVGYVFAHYASVLMVEAQRFVDVFFVSGEPLTVHHGDATVVAYALPSAIVLSLLQVVSVVAGHVFGVIAAHDSAVGALPSGRRVLPQVPLFVVMIALTLGGLTLLLAA